MEVKKIRIGNDINLSVDIRQYLNDHRLLERHVYNPEVDNFYNVDSDGVVNKIHEVYYPNQYKYPDGKIDFRPDGSPVSIRKIKAILINNDRKQEVADLRREMREEWEEKMREYRNDLRRHSRFIARFPIEPAMECFEPTPYDICCSGYPTYRAYPRHYLFAPYHGFGVHPRWSGIYKPICPAPPMPMPSDESFSLIKDDYEYVAQVAATKYQSVVEVLFPAKDQYHTGMYSLLLIVEVYVPGYNASNTKTITIDIPNVFEIVGTSQEAKDYSNIEVNVDYIEDHLSMGEEGELYPSEDESDTVKDIYVDSGLVDGDNITLNRTDGSTVNVDISSISGWYEGE